ncbi:HAD-IIIC family phosphatase [SAR202 cluster bacterium AD-802-F09_MRT_200m]|nr:HAD-IIIC family phosphatase [SAR202 cluster bacterium AD-802-F09_MRT_200m]
MKLIEALQILQKDWPSNGEAMAVFLACGCTPLHLETFLTAQLQTRYPGKRIIVKQGLYGDIIGNLERMPAEEPEVGMVVLEWSDFDPRLGIRRLGRWRPEGLPEILDSARAQAERIREAIERTSQTVPLVISQPTLPLPPVCYMSGGQTGGFDLRLRDIVGAFCAQLETELNVKFINSQRLDRLSPPADRLDVKSELYSGFPYRLPHASAMAELLSDLAAPVAAKKGLITDLDDTLWRGILGDEGPDGVSWDLDRHSHIHGLYQQLLRSLSDAGVLIAVASKNDPELVEQAFKRQDLILQSEHLFPMDVHWGPKSDSIGRILGEWNIGADSVVFVDDSPMELAEVKSAHPDVECLQFPTDRDQAVYSLLEQLGDLFAKDRVSEEDSIRLASVRQGSTLREAAEKTGGISDEFLENSEGKVSVSFCKEPLDPRGLELVNKTNQFNLNGRRIREGEWSSNMKKAESFLLLVAYEDKYGPLGKIAVVTGAHQSGALTVKTWVLSCRAFSRRIEYKCLELLFEKFGVDEIAFDFEATPRNGPMQEFFTKFSERLASSGDGKPVRISKDTFQTNCPRLFHQTKELIVA